MQRPTRWLSMTDTVVNRESGWVGFVDIIMRLAKSSGSPTQPARLWWGERRQWLPTADVVGGYCNYLPNAQRLLTLANRLLKPEKFHKFCSIARH